MEVVVVAVIVNVVAVVVVVVEQDTENVERGCERLGVVTCMQDAE